MQDTAETIEPAGQADDTTTTTGVEPAGQANAVNNETTGDDEQAQLLLADAMNDAAEDTSGGESQNVWDDPESARREIEKLRRENASRRTKLRDAEALAGKWREYEDSQKTELQRATEAAAASRQELEELRATNARMMAAVTHNLPADLIDFLGSGTEEEINTRARVLAEKLAAATPVAETAAGEPPRPALRRPVEALTPGARPADEPLSDPNEAFRQFVNARRS